MSIQIQPQKNFAIVRQLPDPSDSTTYYVRAVIRNAETDELIDTINLTDKTERRFIGIWRAIADKSGQGTLVSIRTAVYTDSGYSTPSDTYAQEMETYLILERFNPNVIVSQLGPAMGGDEVDYKRIAKIVDFVVKEKIKEVIKLLNRIDTKETKEKEVIEEISAAILGSADRIIEAIPEPTEKTDLSPVLEEFKRLDAFENIYAALAMLKSSVDGKEVDFSPVLDALKEIEENKKPDIDHTEKMKKVFDEFSEQVKEITPQVSSLLKTLSDELRDAMIPTKLFNISKPEAPEVKKPDHQQRARELVGDFKSYGK